MDCYFFGIAGLALLAASVSTMTVSEEQHNLLRAVFSPELDKRYEAIIAERRNHYMIGLALGLVLSFALVGRTGILRMNRFTRIGFFFTITLTTAVVFYMLAPKSDYMLNHLRTPEENRKWLAVYKTMKQRYFVGFLLGALVAIPVAGIVCA